VHSTSGGSLRREVFKDAYIKDYNALPTDILKNQFLKDFEEVVNTSVLGSANGCVNWRLEVGKDKDNRQCINDQMLPTTHVQKFLAKFDLLAVLCISLKPHQLG
jgi:hypothetical protein